MEFEPMTSVIPVQILKALGIRNFPYIRIFFLIYKITLGARGFFFFVAKLRLWYPGCQRSSHSPAARNVGQRVVLLAASRLVFAASPPTRKKNLWYQGTIVSGGAAIEIVFFFAIHNRSFATKKQPFWYLGYYKISMNLEVHSNQVINPKLLNCTYTMQNMPFHSQRWENIGTQAIHQDHWSVHLYLSQCHLRCNLHWLLAKRRRLGYRFRESENTFVM